jgi:preprotein translocase SecE subunit
MRAKSSEDNEDIQTKARVIEAEFTDEELAKEQSSQAQKNSSSGSSSSSSSSETIGTETAGDFIRKQKELKADEGNNIFQGASEEIGLIEWPSTGKALKTTLIVIAGIVVSAVFLLVVNEFLSRVSTEVFK